MNSSNNIDSSGTEQVPQQRTGQTGGRTSNIFNSIGNIFADTFRNVFMDELGEPLTQTTTQNNTTYTATSQIVNDIPYNNISGNHHNTNQHNNTYTMTSTILDASGMPYSTTITLNTLIDPNQVVTNQDENELANIFGFTTTTVSSMDNNTSNLNSVSGDSVDISENTPQQSNQSSNQQAQPRILENFVVNTLANVFNGSNIINSSTNMPYRTTVSASGNITGSNYSVLRNRERRYNILNRLGNIFNNPVLRESNNLLSQSIQNSFLNSDTYRLKILKEEEYEKWEKKKYKDMDDEFKENNKECSITMEDYNDDDIVVKMPCGHYMSETACKDWFGINYKCPFCRKEFDNRFMSDSEYNTYRQKIDDENRREAQEQGGETSQNNQENNRQNENIQALNLLLRNTLGVRVPQSSILYTGSGYAVRLAEPNSPSDDAAPDSNVPNTLFYSMNTINEQIEQMNLQRAIEESMRTQ
jgi:hypothetical protein